MTTARASSPYSVPRIRSAPRSSLSRYSAREPTTQAGPVGHGPFQPAPDGGLVRARGKGRERGEGAGLLQLDGPTDCGSSSPVTRLEPLVQAGDGELAPTAPRPADGQPVTHRHPVPPGQVVADEHPAGEVPGLAGDHVEPQGGAERGRVGG